MIFETLGEIDFTISGSPDTPAPEIIARDNTGIATNYRLTRFVNAVSGETKTKSFTITSPTKFLELDLGEDNVIEVLNCVDSSGQRWYEVDYLAQDRILKESHYTQDGRGDAYNQDLVGSGVSSDVAIPFDIYGLGVHDSVTSSANICYMRHLAPSPPWLRFVRISSRYAGVELIRVIFSGNVMK